MQQTSLTHASINPTMLHEHRKDNKRLLGDCEWPSLFRSFSSVTFLSKPAKQLDNEFDTLGQLRHFRHRVPPIRWATFEELFLANYVTFG